MKSASLVVLILLLASGSKPIIPDSGAFNSQTPTKATAVNKRIEATSWQFTQALADATTVPPASASKASPAKANNAGAPPCSRQPAVNHDAQVLPNRNKTQWPQSRLPAEKQKQCQAQKPLPKPPSRK
jgi:hypothetical protein